jgi:hypothetical protein
MATAILVACVDHRRAHDWLPARVEAGLHARVRCRTFFHPFAASMEKPGRDVSHGPGWRAPDDGERANQSRVICIGGCKISYFDVINLYPSIRSKLLYLTGQIDASLRMDMQPSNEAVCFFRAAVQMRKRSLFEKTYGRS